MKKRIIIAGAGGFGREVAWVAGRMDPDLEIVGFCDDNPEKNNCIKDIAPYLGKVGETLASYNDCSYFCAIGNNQVRKKISSLFIEAGVDIISIIDPDSVIAPGTVVGSGSFIGVNSVISVDCRIGCGVIINHNVTVGHGVKVQDFVQICPGACISGGCEIGEGTLFGSISCVIPCRIVGEWCVVGAGSVVISDLQPGAVRARIK